MGGAAKAEIILEKVKNEKNIFCSEEELTVQPTFKYSSRNHVCLNRLCIVERFTVSVLNEITL